MGSAIAKCAAAGAAFGTFRFLEKEEEVWYRDEFEEFAEEVFETTSSRVLIAEESLAGLAASYTAQASLAAAAQMQQPQQAQDANQTDHHHNFYWLPYFWVAAQTLLETTPMTMVFWCWYCMGLDDDNDMFSFSVDNARIF